MTLEELAAKIDRLTALVTQALSEKKTGMVSGAASVADDGDLDSQFGNPTVRKDPTLWIRGGGASYEGKPFSECPSDYLLSLASFFDWQAGKDEAEGTPEKLKYAGYARKDAARARGWAKRDRETPKIPIPADGSLPF